MNKLFLLIAMLTSIGCSTRCIQIDHEDGFEVISVTQHNDGFRYEILEGGYDRSDFDKYDNVGFIFISKKVFHVGDKVQLVKVDE